MKISKKSKKEKKLTDESMMPEQISTQVPQDSESSSLFQTLTQRTEENSEESSVSFVPFTATKKVDEEEKSKLRIIPNVADIDRNFTSFTAITSSHSVQEEKQEEKKKDLIICEQCGTTLSSDYAYCNKCGNKL
jgi:ribosomal protein L40E